MIPGMIGDTISELSERMNTPRDVCSIMESIKHHLSIIKRFVAAAVEQDDEATQQWLPQVTDVITDLWDLLEDHHDLPAAMPQNQNMMMASLFSLCTSVLAPNCPLLQLNQIEDQLRQVGAIAKSKARKEEGAEIIGREEEMEEIVDAILKAEQANGVVLVFKIVGSEGVGKTELARLVCNNERVKSDFDLVIWIDCIRDEQHFSADSVVNRMIELATRMNKQQLKETRGAIRRKLSLGKAIGETRFLLVLDDLGVENHLEWLKLGQILKRELASTQCRGAQLVTTQSQIVGGFGDSYTWYLDQLSVEDSWYLFRRMAGTEELELEVENALKEMVAMCMGVPRMIKRVARTLRLRFPEGTVEESEINQVKDELRVEMDYRNLFSWRLKQCFAYSTLIFSTGNTNDFGSIDAETLIRLWIAEGFLGPVIASSQQPQPEDLGLECIRELHRRSILKFVDNEYGSLGSCSMSNDAKRGSAFVARGDNLCMNDPDEDVQIGVKRVSLASDLNGSIGIPESLFDNKHKLRTIIFPAHVHPDSHLQSHSHTHLRVPYEEKLTWIACHGIFSSFKRVRVLILQDLGLNVLPTSIGDLKRLRYLDLSHNNLKMLPDSVGELKHLQTLRLSHCHQLKELPNDVSHFASLRHLDIDHCLHLTHMPSGLKKLTWLRTLSHFVVSTNKKKTHTGGLWELVNLNNLRGQLEILHLDRLKFKDSNHGQDLGYLEKKQHLESLILRWNHEDGYGNPQKPGKHFLNHDQQCLEYLKPHPNLKGLSIVGYMGNEFPSWLATLKNLVRFSLYNCSKCEKLPQLDELPNLKVLRLERLDSLEFIIDYGDNQQAGSLDKPLFKSLSELIISDCPNLKSWWKGIAVNENNVRFRTISTLQVKHCPKLECMPLFPDLDFELVLECSSLKPLLATLTSKNTSDSESSLPLSKLRRMTVANVNEQSPLPEDWQDNFTSLRRLYIKDCKDLILKSLIEGFKNLTSVWSLHVENCVEIDLPKIDEGRGLKNLRSLELVEMPKLMSLPEGIKLLTSLRELNIQRCPELTALTEGTGYLKSLTLLDIEECQKLPLLPQGLSNLKSLSTLRIINCPKLLPRCQMYTGEDWPHIQHIANVQVKDTSRYYEK
ncbi:hypothetical protein PIB30_032767 [Stylosanthes scabra]|uniref:NB-ARC domain-containing protein n=1 Tax=Stylosanthes scabra TaxID=79078 RepID=A0ABU6UEZ3_9FABA|nr:hypothetical protein [Stylosanthes scabra]